MAFVMIAGPQIISAVFLATSENWGRNCAAYVSGAGLSISIVVIAAFLLGSGASDQGAGDDTLFYVVLGLLAFLAIHTYRTRNTSEPPKWMGRLESSSPKFSFRLGFLLLGVFPSDLITSITVGTYLSGHGAPWWHYLGFLALTLLLLATPALLVVAMGRRAHAFLPKVRDWMNANSWVVSEGVILLFMVLTINDIAS